jgi:DNA end-binding protein Ku
MARSIWRGAISFGLVNVPVKLYSAVSKKTVRFNQLHDADGVRIQQKRVCPADGEEVPYENIVKGYEIAPDKYVIITPEELDALDPKKTRTIDIEDFVDLDEIDPLYYEHPYYLVPDTGASKAYTLLLDALRETNKVAIARVVLRSKEYLTAIRPAGDVLTMETMLFADELVASDKLDELPDEDARATDRELAMARQLIESQATEFDPTKYRDEYRERVLDLIERKAQGEDISVQPDVEEPTEVPDLMAALEASLAAASGSKATASNGAPAKAKAKKPAARKPAAKKPAAKKAPAKKPAARKRAKAGSRS